MLFLQALRAFPGDVPISATLTPFISSIPVSQHIGLTEIPVPVGLHLNAGKPPWLTVSSTVRPASAAP